MDEAPGTTSWLSALEHAPVAAAFFDGSDDWELVWHNGEFSRLMGPEPSGGWRRSTLPHNDETDERVLVELSRDGQSSFTWMFGQVRVRVHAVAHRGGTLVFLRTVDQSVASDERFRAAAAATLDGFSTLMPVVDGNEVVDLRFTFCNEQAQRLIGRAVEGRLLSEVFPDHHDQLLARWSSVLVSGTPYEEEINIGGRWIRQFVAEVAGELAVASFDVTELRETVDRMRLLAERDTLTGLWNRGRMVEFLTDVDDGDAVAVVFVDLDGFKEVNDSLGHVVGDQVLMVIGQRLAGVVPSGWQLARIGGDEFLVVGVGESVSSVERIARSVVEACGQVVDIQGRSVTLAGSAGIAVGRGRDGTGLIELADIAMYEAKRSGRGQVRRYRHGSLEQVRGRYSMQTALRTGIETKELHLEYQPIVETSTGRWSSLEALVRWSPENGSVISPGQFIPVAEASGLILPLGEAVFEQLVSDVGDFPRIDGLCVWINLSAVQLGAPGCFERLVDVAAAIAPVTLGVELTEHTAVSDVMAGSLVLQRLVGAGIPVALDDFGTGYSSLGYLSQLPVSSVKIDQGFTSDLTRSHVARAVVRAVVSMCDELSLASVVEGVEDRTTLAGVTELGATHVSGYLLSRPVRARDLGTIPSELPGG